MVGCESVESFLKCLGRQGDTRGLGIKGGGGPMGFKDRVGF